MIRDIQTWNEGENAGNEFSKPNKQIEFSADQIFSKIINVYHQSYLHNVVNLFLEFLEVVLIPLMLSS